MASSSTGIALLNGSTTASNNNSSLYSSSNSGTTAIAAAPPSTSISASFLLDFSSTESAAIASPTLQLTHPFPHEMDIARLLLGLEMFQHVLAVPVAFASIWLLSRTAVLHFNLKFLLLCQTVSILGRSLLRIIAICTKYAMANFFWSESACAPLSFGLLVSVFFRNFLGHVMLAERVLATIRVRQYEWDRRYRWFSAGWFVPLLLLAIWNGLSTKSTGEDANADNATTFALTSAVQIATGSVTLIMNLVEFTVIAFLFRYNRQKFAQTGAQQNVHNLSERYQLLENIRTTKQLLPVLALHSLSNLNNSCVQVAQLYKIVPNATVQFLFDTNALGFFNASLLTLGMMLATIICHPILRHKASLCLLRLRNRVLGRRSSIRPSASLWDNREGKVAERHKIKEEYFRRLDSFWDSEFNKRTTMPKAATALVGTPGTTTTTMATRTAPIVMTMTRLANNERNSNSNNNDCGWMANINSISSSSNKNNNKDRKRHSHQQHQMIVKQQSVNGIFIRTKGVA